MSCELLPQFWYLRRMIGSVGHQKYRISTSYYTYIKKNNLLGEKDVCVYRLGFLRVSEIIILIQSLAKWYFHSGSQRSQYKYYATAWTTTGMTHFQEVLSSPKPSRPVWGPPSLLFGRYWSSFPGGKSAQGARLTADLQLFPRLRISGAIHLLPPYAFMAWTGTALHVYCRLLLILVMC